MVKKFVEFTDSNPADERVKGDTERISIHALIEAKKPIWVINRSKEFLGIPMFIILDLGGRRSEPIPPGPEPFCISDKISKKKLEDCDDLFRLIDKGVLELISDEEAKDFYKKNPDAKKTLEAKVKAFRAPTEGGAVRGFRDIFGKNVFKQMQASIATSEPETVRGTPKNIVNPKVQWLVQGLEDNIIDVARFQNEIMSLPDGLTPADRAFIKTKPKASAALEAMKI